MRYHLERLTLGLAYPAHPDPPIQVSLGEPVALRFMAVVRIYSCEGIHENAHLI